MCKTLILKNKRYSNLIKDTYKQIEKVKDKCFGNPADNERLKSRLITEVKLLYIEKEEYGNFLIYKVLNNDI